MPKDDWEKARRSDIARRATSTKWFHKRSGQSRKAKKRRAAKKTKGESLVLIEPSPAVFDENTECPFEWGGALTVDRWGGTHTDGDNSDFARAKTNHGIELVRVRGNAPPRDDTIMFGKHIGKHWPDIPFGYLQWLSKNVKGSAKRNAVQELTRRNSKR